MLLYGQNIIGPSSEIFGYLLAFGTILKNRRYNYVYIVNRCANESTRGYVVSSISSATLTLVLYLSIGFSSPAL